MLFEILIDDTLLSDLIPTSTLLPISNKSVLSIVNDYEDNTWRYKKFNQYIWDNISQDALTKEERVSTAEKCEHPLLPIYRERFAEFQKENYYAD